MSFFDIQKYRRSEDETRKLLEHNKRLEEEIKDREWRSRSAEYDRERERHREFEKRERERENAREIKYNLYEEKIQLQAELEDLKLRCKFGVE